MRHDVEVSACREYHEAVTASCSLLPNEYRADSQADNQAEVSSLSQAVIGKHRPLVALLEDLHQRGDDGIERGSKVKPSRK